MNEGSIVLPDIVFTDSDGVLKYSKQNVQPDLIDIVTHARKKCGITVVRITGAPYRHLDDKLPVDRAFAEAGGVEWLGGDNIIIHEHAQHAAYALEQLKQELGIDADDGHVSTPFGAFGLEGIRHVTLTPFFGKHPLYHSLTTTADHARVAGWIREIIQKLRLPLYIRPGKADGYHFIDIGHPDIMKKEIIVEKLLQEIPHKRAFYLGDAGNDAGAMRMYDKLTPVTFENGTDEVKEIVQQGDGILIPLPGPQGGSYEFFSRLISSTL